MKKLIPFDEDYIVIFLEEKTDFKHPVSSYFFNVKDLSINLLISLKWMEWGLKFFEEIRKNMGEESLNDVVTSSISNIVETEGKELIYIDGVEINEINSKDIFFFYSIEAFDENTLIHIKLKLTLSNFLRLNFELFPYFYDTKCIKTL